MNDEVTITLSNTDIEKFKQFMKEYNKITILQESGLFEIKNGQIIIYFSNTGDIMSINLSRKLWKRSLKVDKHKVVS